jgi:hypothetical protein
MTLFEFVLAFSSVISALALGHLLAGAIYIVRRRSIVRFSLTHALWMWSILAFTMGNWAGDWGLRSLTEWPAWTVLLLIFSKIVQYMLCVFVTPDISSTDDKIDLVAFHEREGRNYFWAMIVLGCIALLFNLIFSGIFGSWLRDSVLTLVALGFTFLAILVKAQWAQRLSAVGIASLATYFLIAASTLGTA